MPSLSLRECQALTPDYAAPEQVRGGTVTPAIDVYAMGVLLYRLLVDIHPAGQGCKTAADYMRTIVMTHEAYVAISDRRA